jgi:DNA-binding FadR family transcriptional regulator
MERVGLVARLEGELERIISLGQLPEDGELPSEQTLASRYGVSRSTAREALLRLSARGLVVQHPGRRTRAVALDEALTLENLGMVLHGEGRLSPERRLLLEGYLSLKREVTVELLSACCEHASEGELGRLGQTCFALEDAARWGQNRSQWVTLEFELLRLAAAAAKRPGHLLLLQSLERAFRAISGRVLPYLDSQAVAAWARCAMHALGDRDVQALRTHLPKLLETRDGRVLAALAPTCQAGSMPEALRDGDQAPELAQFAQASDTTTQAHEMSQPDEAPSPATQVPEVGASAPVPAGAEVSGAHWANLYGCQTGSDEAPPDPACPRLLTLPPEPAEQFRTHGHHGTMPPASARGPCSHSPSDPVSRLTLRACSQPGAALPEGSHSRENLPTRESTHGARTSERFEGGSPKG